MQTRGGLNYIVLKRQRWLIDMVDAQYSTWRLNCFGNFYVKDIGILILEISNVNRLLNHY